MADSFSPLLGLRLQQTGNNQNTWGDLLNSDTITPLENATAGMKSRTVSGGTLDLSAAPLVEQVHKFSGTLTADQMVVIPNLTKRMKIWNATGGAFYLTIKTATGTPVCIPQGTLKDVFCDGADSIFRGDRDDIGEIKYFGMTSAPPGFFLCDGAAKPRSGPIDLFNKIAGQWGVPDGSSFNVPNLVTNNRFLRASGGSLTVGTTQTQDVQAHNHTASANTSVTVSILGDGGWTPSISISDPTHTHQVGAPNAIVTVGGSSFVGGLGNGFSTANSTNPASTGISATSTGIGNHNHAGSGGSATTTVTVNNSTGAETRPHNAAALACIRY